MKAIKMEEKLILHWFQESFNVPTNGVPKWLISAFALLLFSCNGSGIEREDGKDSTSAFKTDIPVDKQGKSNFHDWIREERDVIGYLDTLERGYPTLQIRVWYAYMENDQRQVVVLKDEGGWKSELHTTTWVVTDDTFYIKKRTFNTGVPKMGWKSLIDSLTHLDVLTLPDMHRLPEYMDAANSSTVHVEIANKNQYRFYSYLMPVENVSEFPEARKMELILRLIEDQFGFKRLGRI